MDRQQAGWGMIGLGAVALSLTILDSDARWVPLVVGLLAVGVGIWLISHRGFRVSTDGSASIESWSTDFVLIKTPLLKANINFKASIDFRVEFPNGHSVGNEHTKSMNPSRFGDRFVDNPKQFTGPTNFRIPFLVPKDEMPNDVDPADLCLRFTKVDWFVPIGEMTMPGSYS